MLHNIILDNLPQITPHGYKIKTDFRQWIKFELLMQDHTISDDEKIALSLNLVYEKIENPSEQVEDIIFFYAAGKTSSQNKIKGENKVKQIYSYEYDAELIFSAFMQQYGININLANMHWWKFKALFDGLTEKTRFVEIMGYRAVDLSKISDKEEKKRYKKLKKIYQLPDMRTAAEKEADFGAAFW